MYYLRVGRRGTNKFSDANEDRGKNIFFCSAGHEQDWQPNSVDPHIRTHTYIQHNNIYACSSQNNRKKAKSVSLFTTYLKQKCEFRELFQSWYYRCCLKKNLNAPRPCCFSHSAYWLPTRKKLLYRVANPARGLLNREKRTKEKVWQHTPPHCSFGEK